MIFPFYFLLWELANSLQYNFVFIKGRIAELLF